MGGNRTFRFALGRRRIRIPARPLNVPPREYDADDQCVPSPFYRCAGACLRGFGITYRPTIFV